MATKVERSIGADPAPLVQRAISAIFLPKFLTFYLGTSVSLKFCNAWKNAGTAAVLGDKGKDLRTGGKSMRTNESGPKPRPQNSVGRQWLTNRKKYLFAARYVTVSIRQQLTNIQKYIC